MGRRADAVVRRRTRGSVYVPVLGTCLLVTVIGLAGLSIARARTASSLAASAAGEAREVARAGLALALERIERDDAWRSLAAGVWFKQDVPGRTGGTVSVRLDDPVDGDLGDDPADPVRIEATGTGGGGVARVAAVVRVHERASALERRVVALGGLGVGSSWIDGRGAIHVGGAASTSGSEVGLELLTADVASGTDWRGVVTEGTTAPVLPAIEDVIATWSAGAVTIDARTLPRGGADLLGTGSFEDGLGAWTASDAKVELTVDAQAAVDGGRSLRVTSRGDETAGPRLDLTELVAAGTVPRVRARVRVEPPATRADLELWLAWAGEDRTTVDAGPRVTASGPDWVELEVTGTMRDLEDVGDVTLLVATPGSTDPIRIDDVRVHDANATNAPRLLERVALGPDVNPFGAAASDGRYVLDLAGRDVIVRDCRIVGTLVLLRPGPGSRIEGSVAWRPVTPGDPVLLTDATTLRLATTDAPLCESTVGRTLDPPALPFPWKDGSSGTALDAIIPSRIDGVLWVKGTLLVQGQPRVRGTLVAGASVAFSGARAVLEPGDGAPGRIPAGFTADVREVRMEPGHPVRRVR